MIIPLHYWWSTRIETPSKFVAYLVALLPVWVAFSLDTSAHASHLLPLALAWFTYLSLYELGYFMNDFWSHPREVARGLSLDRPSHTPPSRSKLSLAIASRVITFCAGLAALSWIVGTREMLFFLFIVAVTAAVFVTHNILLVPRWRLVTLFALYLLRYPLVVVALTCEAFTNSGASALNDRSVVLLVSSGLLSLSTMIGYGAAKGLLWGPKDKPAADISRFSLRTAALFFLAWLVTAPLHLESHHLLPSLGVFYLLTWLTWSLGRFAFGAYRSSRSRKAAFHVHTNFSHDCNLSTDEVAALAKQKGFECVYVADHAEDLSTETFTEYLSAFERTNSSKAGARLYPGLEYDVFGQHILALNLSSFVDLSIEDHERLRKLKSLSSQLIWAHPHFPIKKVLLSSSYRSRLFTLMKAVDGLEWKNLKSTRGFSYAWRHITISLVTLLFVGGKKIITGIDAHSRNDWLSLR